MVLSVCPLFLFASPSVVVAGVADGPSESVVRPPRRHGQHVADRQWAIDVVELQHLRSTNHEHT